MSWGNRSQWESWHKVSSASTPETARPKSRRAAKPISPKQKSKLERQLAIELELEGLVPAREYRFHPERRWRFDFAFPDEKIAAEVNGGIYKNGRHSRGAGQEGDYEKLNAAIDRGWFVFQFGPNQIRRGEASLLLARAVRTRRAQAQLQ